MGFSNAQATPVGPDDGVDVLGSGVVAEVKFKGVEAPPKDVRAVVGAAAVVPGASPAFFSLDGFTAQAVAYGEAAGVALFTFDYSGEPIAVSTVAEEWMAGGGKRRAPPAGGRTAN